MSRTILALMLGAVALPVYAQESQDTAVVQITLNTAYDDVSQDLERIGALNAMLASLPSREMKVRQGETIATIIQREFGILPIRRGIRRPAYDAILDDIRTRNPAIGSPETLLPGSLLVPALPRVNSSGTSEYLNPQQTPSVTVGKLSAAAYQYEEAVATKPTLERSDSVATVVFRLPAGAAENLTAGVNSAPAAAKATETVVSATMHVRLHPSAEELTARLERSHNVLSQTEASFLDSLARTARRRVYLVILDSGWPDQAACVTAKQAVFEMVQAARAELGVPVRDRPASFRCEGFSPPSDRHSKVIKESLREFTELPSAESVRVVYLPLTTEQSAGPVLKELLIVHFIEQLQADRATQGGCPKSNPDCASGDEAEAGRQADLVLERLPQAFVTTGLVTDKAIVESAWRVLSLASTANGTFGFLSESWVVAPNYLKVMEPDDPAAIVVAAAGNEGTDIYTNDRGKRLDFASRSQKSDGYLAVVNMDRSGAFKAKPICKSSFVDLQYIQELPTVRVVGFDGRTRESDDECGSSFAAPRVAWLLALREAIRQTEPKDNSTYWIKMFKRLRDARDGSDAANILLHPITLLLQPEHSVPK